ncbi:MAG TPA: TetR/AcrR family transcriptional regulator [Fontimonas sp.]
MNRKSDTRTKGGKSSPGRPRKFEFEDIVSAALEVMEEEGYSTLTMRSLANKLGIAHGNLYTYVGHIEDVETAVLKRLLDSLPTPPPAPVGAAELRIRFVEFLHAARRALIRHPRIMQSTLGSQAWHSFSALSLQWTAALGAVEKDGPGAMTGFSVAISFIASHAERERLHGPDYMAQGLSLLKQRHDAQLIAPLIEQSRAEPGVTPLDRSLDLILDRMFPKMAAAHRRRRS